MRIKSPFKNVFLKITNKKNQNFEKIKLRIFEHSPSAFVMEMLGMQFCMHYKLPVSD